MALRYDDVGTINAVKLLPKIDTLNGYIQLYSELDSHIEEGDTIYITYKGDIQNITKNDVILDNYITSLYNDNYNFLYSNYLQGYKILYVDKNINTFVINRSITTIPYNTKIYDHYVSRVSSLNSLIDNCKIDGSLFKKSDLNNCSNWVQGIVIDSTIDCSELKDKYDANYISLKLQYNSSANTYSKYLNLDNDSYGYSYFYNINPVNDTIIGAGLFYDSIFLNSSETIRDAYFENCVVSNYSIYGGYFKNCTATTCVWYNGNWDGNTFDLGNWTNGNFYSGVFGSTGNTNTWQNGNFIGGVWRGNSWKNGIFLGGLFEGTGHTDSISDKQINSIWYNGKFAGGVMSASTFNQIVIYDGVIIGGDLYNVNINKGSIYDGNLYNSFVKNITINGGHFSNSSIINCDVRGGVYDIAGNYNSLIMNSNCYDGVFNNTYFLSHNIIEDGKYYNSFFYNPTTINNGVFDTCKYLNYIVVGSKANVREILLLSGATTNCYNIAQLTYNNNYGALNFGTGFNGVVYCMVEQPDGKIIVGGDFTEFSGVTMNRIARLNSDGTLDPTFVIGSGFDAAVRTITLNLDSSGSVYVGGDFGKYGAIVSQSIIKLDSGGTIDSSFVIGAGFDQPVRCISIGKGPDFDVYVGGDFGKYDAIGISQSIIKLNSIGHADSTFQLNADSGFDNRVYCMKIANDLTHIIIGGNFTTYSGVTYERIIRLNLDGSVDFSGGGSGADGVVHSIELDSSDNIYIGGAFTTYQGQPYGGIAKIKSNGGILYPAPGVGADSTIYSLSLSADTYLFAGGDFTTYDGITTNNFVRLESDCTLKATYNVISTTTSIRSIVSQPANILIGGDFNYTTPPPNLVSKILVEFPDEYYFTDIDEENIVIFLGFNSQELYNLSSTLIPNNTYWDISVFPPVLTPGVLTATTSIIVDSDFKPWMFNDFGAIGYALQHYPSGYTNINDGLFKNCDFNLYGLTSSTAVTLVNYPIHINGGEFNSCDIRNGVIFNGGVFNGSNFKSSARSVTDDMISVWNNGTFNNGTFGNDISSLITLCIDDVETKKYDNSLTPTTSSNYTISDIYPMVNKKPISFLASWVRDYTLGAIVVPTGKTWDRNISNITSYLNNYIQVIPYEIVFKIQCDSLSSYNDLSLYLNNLQEYGVELYSPIMTGTTIKKPYETLKDLFNLDYDLGMKYSCIEVVPGPSNSIYLVFNFNNIEDLYTNINISATESLAYNKYFYNIWSISNTGYYTHPYPVKSQVEEDYLSATTYKLYSGTTNSNSYWIYGSAVPPWCISNDNSSINYNLCAVNPYNYNQLQTPVKNNNINVDDYLINLSGMSSFITNYPKLYYYFSTESYIGTTPFNGFHDWMGYHINFKNKISPTGTTTYDPIIYNTGLSWYGVPCFIQNYWYKYYTNLGATPTASTSSTYTYFNYNFHDVLLFEAYHKYRNSSTSTVNGILNDIFPNNTFDYRKIIDTNYGTPSQPSQTFLSSDDKEFFRKTNLNIQTSVLNFKMQTGIMILCKNSNLISSEFRDEWYYGKFNNGNFNGIWNGGKWINGNWSGYFSGQTNPLDNPNISDPTSIEVKNVLFTNYDSLIKKKKWYDIAPWDDASSKNNQILAPRMKK